jgi:arylsulfatase
MEIYAAMVENLDANIGRLVDHLVQTDQYDNTFIMFFSDNGAEGNPIDELADNAAWIPERFDNSYENVGRIDSYVYLGPGWAQATTGPFRWFKTFTSEGGIRVPGIVKLPGDAARGARSDAFASVKDVTPTLLELAGTAHPGSSYQGREVAPVQGVSMVPFLRGEADSVHGPDHVMGWELFGRRAIRAGDWKLMWLWKPYGVEAWELFDLAEDPTESFNLIDERPEKRDELLRLWEDYVETNEVILPNHDTSYAIDEVDE